MEKTWRWFGPNDKITLEMLRQIGVEGIVTALHHIPNGEVWSLDEVNRMKDFIEAAGLRWSVVESLPVSESIKYGGEDRDQLIENYKESLRNLGKSGIRTVCYNFMPVLDWARTDLEYPNPDGTSNLYFNLGEFAYFDIHILHRKDAARDYDEVTLARVDELRKVMTPEGKKRLVDNIIVKTQGFVNGNISENDLDPVQKFRDLLALYDGIDAGKLRENMAYFLNAIMPVCREYDINMCVHPDDPPRPILGLPRIVTCDADIRAFLDAVPDSHNGLTFCAGSLSAGVHNDIPALARKYASRTHFVHARICNVLPNGDFKESTHLDQRLIDVVRTFERERPGVPMRVDHAPLMLGDEKMGYNAGYSFHGRMLALGMVSGIMATVHTENT
ncbi:mannonate dehydratase [Duncaniella muris]|uniref:mannonate dehydratase n=1 Tax=Duncaniella muris TaxID=2094150 RepID=UPI00136E49D3|nr:mannonate dehydratase [Duncaniella muris]NBH91991.1 mannonate dehydratase [Muribaculaceae bacterium S4]NBI19961.1 mannonate dehydratase [Muribaculaceae bacterium Z1]GFI52578.1 mannonate dehydratase [Muribaculaceae bacterium]